MSIRFSAYEFDKTSSIKIHYASTIICRCLLKTRSLAQLNYIDRNNNTDIYEFNVKHQ